jgi:hypothetical protein
MRSGEAERHGRVLLGSLRDRWLHTEGVAARARSLVAALDDLDGEVLMAAAWLHDVGYAPALVVSGFHPLDGARWLLGRGEGRVAGLVAHHTAASAEAELRGLDVELGEFRDEASLVSAALAYCDRTTGPQGQRMDPAERLAEVVQRHGEDSLIVVGLRASWPSLVAAVARVEVELVKADQPR